MSSLHSGFHVVCSHNTEPGFRQKHCRPRQREQRKKERKKGGRRRAGNVCTWLIEKPWSLEGEEALSGEEGKACEGKKKEKTCGDRNQSDRNLTRNPNIAECVGVFVHMPALPREKRGKDQWPIVSMMRKLDSHSFLRPHTLTHTLPFSFIPQGRPVKPTVFQTESNRRVSLPIRFPQR